MLERLELDFAGKTFTADALLTRRKLADFLRARGAHFVFTAKGNQPTLLDDLRLFFDRRGEPDFREPFSLQHGRLESRAIRTTARLNGHLTFPHVGQAFLVERTAVAKKSGKRSVECALGITSHAPDTADARRLLELNRGHWKVESVHNILDNAFDEDRLRIRTGRECASVCGRKRAGGAKQGVHVASMYDNRWPTTLSSGRTLESPLRARREFLRLRHHSCSANRARSIGRVSSGGKSSGSLCSRISRDSSSSRRSSMFSAPNLAPSISPRSIAFAARSTIIS